MKRSRALTLPALLTFCVLLLGGAFSAFAQDSSPAAPDADQTQVGAAEGLDAVQAGLGTAFTYQGNLKKAGQPVTTTCSFQFSLWDALTAGAQQGATQTASGVQVQAGVFTIALDFGSQFTGEARWLQTAVQCAGDASFVTLSPRQPLNAVPYALGLRPGVAIKDVTTTDSFYAEKNAANATAIHGKGTANGSIGVWGEGVGNTGVYGLSQGGRGVWGKSTSTDGVLGESASGAGVSGNSTSFYGVDGLTQSTNYAGVRGTNLSTGVSGAGVHGVSTNGPGVNGVSTSGNGVKGTSTDSAGVYGVSTNGSGLYGSSSNSNGVYGQTAASNQPGVRGVNAASSGIGVRGEANATGSVGVWGQSNANTGVYGLSTNGIGVWGQSTNGPAMRADGNAVQASSKGGWVKAMAYVRSDGLIFGCYNGVTGSSSNGCGFTVNHFTAGGYGIDFGFYVGDRFVSVTATRNALGNNMDAEFDFGAANTTIDVRTFRANQSVDTEDTRFMIIVF